MTMQRTLVLSAWAVLGLAASARAQLPAGTSFTYQGRLEDAGSPATGSYDFQFRLFAAAAGGTQVGGTVARPGVVVAAGLFTVDLDFGAGVFTGDALWLEVAVRPAGSGAFTILSPRQRASGAPYAIHALSIPLAGSGTATTAARSDHDHAGTYATSIHTHDAADLTSGTIAPARVSGAYGGISGVGTLGSGTWNASPIGSLFGGTGQTSWATGDLLFASATNTLARLPVGATNKVLSVSGGLPAWADANAHDHVGQTWSTSTASFALDITSNAPTFGAALRATHSGTGITAMGIYGVNMQPLGGAVGVRGDATDLSAINYGVYGNSVSSNGRAVAGVATATAGVPVGVYGQVASTTGWGVYTPNNTYVGGSLRVGVVGTPSARLDVVGQARIETASGAPPLLIATPYASGANVANLSADLLDGLDSSAFAPGVHNHAGETWSATSGSYGLNVVSTSAATGAAIRGVHSGAVPAFGVEGINNQAVAGGAGVFGVTTNTSLVNYGVLGRTQSSAGTGVRGEASVATGDAWGVHGLSISSAGRGVVGSTLATTGTTYGVYGTTTSTDGFGLYTPNRAHVGGAFTVAGASVLTGNLAVGGAGTSARLSIVPSSSPGVRELEFTGGVLQAVEVLANNNMLIGTATASDLQLQTGLATRLFISGSTGLVGIGTGAPTARLDVEQAGLPVAEFNRTTNDGAVINISQDGVIEGSISVTGTTVSYNAFTGSHYAWPGDVIERGMLVSLTGENRTLHGRPDTEPIYGIASTTWANDPAVLGAYLGRLEPSQPDRPVTDNPHLVAAVGNGELWVVDAGGDIEPGDSLIASATPGHAMRDDDRFDVSHVVARAAERVRWRDVTDRRDGVRRRLISVLFESHARETTSALRSALDRSTRELAELRLLLAAQSSRLEVLEAALASERENVHRAAVRPLLKSER